MTSSASPFAAVSRPALARMPSSHTPLPGGAVVAVPVDAAVPAWLAWSRRAALAVVVMLPLAAWPGLERPFSTPKLYALVAAVIVLGPFGWLASRTAGLAGPVRIVAAMWLASWSWSALMGDIVSLDALLLALAAGLFALTLAALAPRPEALAAALVAGPTAVAVVALLQWAGVDPFALAGWIAPLAGASERLRIYGTLGNPNFVAALLAAAIPLTAALVVARWSGSTRGKVSSQVAAPHLAMPTTVGASAGMALVLLLALVGQLAALAATGSRAGALGLAAAGLTALALGAGRPGRRAPRPTLVDVDDSRPDRRTSDRARPRILAIAALAAVGCAAMLVFTSSARPLGDTLAGRLYIWRVTAPHALEAVVAGRGPGAFELLHPGWELAARPDAGHPDARFAGPQQYAHNDYLEALVDRGFAGPVTILAVLATSWAAGRRRTRRTAVTPLALGAVASVTALAAVACVDFPLARPAELAMWWSALTLAHSRHFRSDQTDESQKGYA